MWFNPTPGLYLIVITLLIIIIISPNQPISFNSAPPYERYKPPPPPQSFGNTVLLERKNRGIFSCSPRGLRFSTGSLWVYTLITLLVTGAGLSSLENIPCINECAGYELAANDPFKSAHGGMGRIIDRFSRFELLNFT